MRARHVILHRAFTVLGVDDYNNEIEGWSSPVERKIFGINYPESVEDPAEGPNRMSIDMELLVPNSLVSLVSARDRFAMVGAEDEEYEVIGIARSGKSPYRFRPGGLIRLVRVEG